MGRLVNAWFDGAMPNDTPRCGAVVRIPESEWYGERTAEVLLLNEVRTTNVAEYGGLLIALEFSKEIVQSGDHLIVHGDSQLVVYTVTGRYQSRKPHLQPYVAQARALIKELTLRGVAVTLQWVPRELNKEADRLSKQLA